MFISQIKNIYFVVPTYYKPCILYVYYTWFVGIQYLIPRVPNYQLFFCYYLLKYCYQFRLAEINNVGKDYLYLAPLKCLHFNWEDLKRLQAPDSIKGLRLSLFLDYGCFVHV